MENTTPNPWKTFLSTLGMGILGIGGGIYMYYDLADWERTGGTRYMNSIIYFAYHLVGKGGVLGFCLLAGVASLVFGILDLRKQLKSRSHS